MARVFLALVALMAIIIVSEGGYKAKNKCKKVKTKFQKCLDGGYQSTDGCVSGDGKLSKKNERKCRKLEKKAKKCNFTCDIPKPYNEKCVRAGTDFKGADIRWFDTDSFDTCAKECANTSGCQSITYRAENPHCWLKNKRGGKAGPNMDSSLTSMNMECDTSPLETSCKD